jgi:hypothetical protein
MFVKTLSCSWVIGLFLIDLPAAYHSDIYGLTLTNNVYRTGLGHRIIAFLGKSYFVHWLNGKLANQYSGYNADQIPVPAIDNDDADACDTYCQWASDWSQECVEIPENLRCKAYYMGKSTENCFPVATAITNSHGIYYRKSSYNENATSLTLNTYLHEAIHWKYRDPAVRHYCVAITPWVFTGIMTPFLLYLSNLTAIDSKILFSGITAMQAYLAGKTIAQFLDHRLDRYFEQRAEVMGTLAITCSKCFDEVVEQRFANSTDKYFDSQGYPTRKWGREVARVRQEQGLMFDLCIVHRPIN